MEQDTLSDDIVLALHGYCEKHVTGAKDTPKVSLVVTSPTEGVSSNGGAGNHKPTKPKRSHKKKVAPPATDAAPTAAEIEATQRSPPVQPSSAPAPPQLALDASHTDFMRYEAERAAAVALEREVVVEPLFGDEHEPIEGLGGEGFFGGMAEVPISTDLFGGTGA